jgi:hypothetical protein
MVSPLELRALSVDRTVSSKKLWVWRILTVVVLANVASSTAGSMVELGGAIVGAGAVMVTILYALGDEAEQEPPKEQAAA